MNMEVWKKTDFGGWGRSRGGPRALRHPLEALGGGLRMKRVEDEHETYFRLTEKVWNANAGSTEQVRRRLNTL